MKFAPVLPGPKTPKPGASVNAGSTDSNTPAVQGYSYQTFLPGLPPGGGSGVGVYGFTGSGAGVVGISGSGVGVSGSCGSGPAGEFENLGDSDALVAITTSPNHAAVSASNNCKAGGKVPSAFGVWAHSSNTGIYSKGTPAGYFDGDVQVNGDVVLSGGSDFAEEFDLTGGVEADPGTVMVLDGEGGVQPSCRAYDRKAAGIISGAGDYRPGIILGKRESTRPRGVLALVGKVYCKVDASYAPIEIGDMLTTSPTCGHAMKAVDAAQSFGAVIGKALRSISEGQGQIPVLVALQ